MFSKCLEMRIIFLKLKKINADCNFSDQLIPDYE